MFGMRGQGFETRSAQMRSPFRLGAPTGTLGQGEGYEFGTNTGRQGTFNPGDERHKSMAIERLKALQTQYGERLNPRFTGYTGLAPGDSKGYADMLNARTEALNIQRLLSGQGPMNIAYGGMIK